MAESDAFFWQHEASQINAKLSAAQAELARLRREHDARGEALRDAMRKNVELAAEVERLRAELEKRRA